MKKAVSLLLVFVLLCCFAPAAFAGSDEAQSAADTLYSLGLFKGTGTNEDGTPIFDLDREPTRNEAITMLVRLLGKEAEAKTENWETPFTDVADWAKPYVGYAYANGLTKGTGDTTFGGDSLITASQYITFALRALGYESGTDFQWDRAWELSDRIGLTDGRYNASSSQFLRGDVAIISAKALPVKLKGSNVMLLRKLYNQLSAEKASTQAKKKSVSDYGLPEAVGVTTLSYDDAFALVGKDPEIIAKAVKTVGDVRQYMIAANFVSSVNGPFTPWYGKQEWGFDAPGDEQLRQNYGCCCGGFTNMGLYLLEGDYEETGVIRWLGGGNHTICYVRYDGKYYAFDLTEYAPGIYPSVVLDRLEDFYDQMPDAYPKSEITNLVALKDTTVTYPWGGGGEKASYLVFPSEVKDHVLQIYQKDSSAAITFKDISVDIPMWNSDKLNAPASDAKYDTFDELKQRYLDLRIASIVLLRPFGQEIHEKGRFGTDLHGTESLAVLADGQVITDYEVKNSDETVCTFTKGTDGKLITSGLQKGICTLSIIYMGRTAKFYYAIGYGEDPPFDAYIAKENAS